MKTNWIIAFLILFALNSCKKNFDAQFNVKIINPATGEGYANTKFFVRSERTGANGEVLKTEAEGTTNDVGEAVVTIKIKGNKSYYVTIEALPNICYVNDIRKYYNDRTDKNPEFVFEIAPCGNLRVHFNNQNCQGPNDTLEFYYVSAQVPFGVPGVPTILTGCVNILDDPISFPMGQRNYMWKVIRNGNEQTFEGSVYVEPNSTSILEVFY